MSKFLKPFFLLIVFNLVIGFQTFSQIKDFQSWNSISIEKKVNKKTSLLLDQEFRFQENASQFEDYITVLGAQYEINKYIKISGAYRFTYSTSFENGVKNENRYFADLSLKYKVNRFTLGSRTRYQMEYQKHELNHWHTLRNKFSVKYNINKSKLTPVADYEFYYSLNSPVKNLIYRSRYTLGMDYEISKTLSVNSYYQLQTQRDYLRKPRNTYILGLGLNITL